MGTDRDIILEGNGVVRARPRVIIFVIVLNAESGKFTRKKRDQGALLRVHGFRSVRRRAEDFGARLDPPTLGELELNITCGAPDFFVVLSVACLTKAALPARTEVLGIPNHGVVFPAFGRPPFQGYVRAIGRRFIPICVLSARRRSAEFECRVVSELKEVPKPTQCAGFSGGRADRRSARACAQARTLR